MSEFRVEKRDLPVLADALQLPETFYCNQRTTADKLEGLYFAQANVISLIIINNTKDFYSAIFVGSWRFAIV